MCDARRRCAAAPAVPSPTNSQIPKAAPKTMDHRPLTARPRYRVRGDRGTGRPSCSAFLMAMVGCMMQVSVNPARPPMAVCSRGVTELMATDNDPTNWR